MTEEQLLRRTAKYNSQAAANLNAYRRKVIALCQLGLVLILLFCLPFFALLAFAIERCTDHFLLGSFLLFICLIILSRIIGPLLEAVHTQPETIPLTPTQSPELFGMVKETAASLGINANIQIELHKHLAVFGRTGKRCTTLNLGLPLLQTLTPQQFRSILINELIHIRTGNEHLQHKITSRMQRWNNLKDSLNGSLLGTLSAPFFKYTLPWIDLHTYPLYCHNVLQNDIQTTRFCNPDELAAALCNLHAAAGYLEADFWQQFSKQSEQHDRPLQMPFSAYPGYLKTASLQSHLDNALNMPHYVQNPRPTLQNRLRNLSRSARLNFPAPDQSAATLLGEALPDILQQFDEEWWNHEVSAHWEQAHTLHQERIVRLQELDKQAVQNTLDERTAFERAMLTEHIAKNTESALQQLTELYRRNPQASGVCLEYGRLLLDKHDGDGVPIVRRAAELNDDLIIEAATIERNYHHKYGRHEAAVYCQNIIDRQSFVKAAAQAERDNCTPHDALTPADIPPQELAGFLNYLNGIDGLDEVYLAQKEVQFQPHKPIYIIAFVTRPGLLKNKNKAIDRITAALIRAPFPHEAFIVALDNEFMPMLPRLKRIANARIYG